MYVGRQTTAELGKSRREECLCLLLGFVAWTVNLLTSAHASCCDRALVAGKRCLAGSIVQPGWLQVGRELHLSGAGAVLCGGRILANHRLLPATLQTESAWRSSASYCT